MIYPNKKLEIAVTEYMTQIDGKPHKYYDDDFFFNSNKFRKNVSK